MSALSDFIKKLRGEVDTRGEQPQLPPEYQRPVGQAKIVEMTNPLDVFDQNND